jgi:hypothetical protein
VPTTLVLMPNEAREALAAWEAERADKVFDAAPLVRALQATWLLAAGEQDVAAYFIRRRVVRAYDPDADAGYAALVDRVVAG